MPRGTRAIHGAEVQLGAHGHSDYMVTHISPACKYLAMSCWCDTHIVIGEQQDVRNGKTYTCGLPLCEGPNGEREESIAVLCTSSGADWAPPIGAVDEDRVLELAYALNTKIMGRKIEQVKAKMLKQLALKQANPGKLREKKGRTYPSRLTAAAQAIATRREVVKQLWSEGKSDFFIAGACAVPVHTVRNDVFWLRSRGLIGYRTGPPKSQWEAG